MDNPRFNITGDTLEELVDVFKLIFKREFKWPEPHLKEKEGYGHFTGYKIHPNHGILLHQYPIDFDDKNTIPFDFAEGKSPIALANFCIAKLKKIKVEDPSDLDSNGYEWEEYLTDFQWDRDCEHDGHNTMGWRVYTGQWGHVTDYRYPYAVRKRFCWHGK